MALARERDEGMNKGIGMAALAVALLAVTACGPDRREQQANHGATEAAIAAGVAARQAPAAAPTETASGPGRFLRFACTDGSEVELRYTPLETVAVLRKDGTTTELDEIELKAGFVHVGSDSAVADAGTVIGVERPGAGPVDCQPVTSG